MSVTSLITPPFAVFTMKTPSFIISNSGVSIIYSVVSEVLMLMKSASFRNASISLVEVNSKSIVLPSKNSKEMVSVLGFLV